MKINKYWWSIVCTIFSIASFSFSQEEFYHPELEWKTIQTEHFYIHYHLGTERTARVAAKIAEEVFEPITALYNYKPKGRVSFVIKDYDDFSNGATYFFDNKIEIWSSALDYDLRGTHNWLRNVISHEFTHLIQIQTALKFGRKIPAIYLQWLQYEKEQRTDVLYGYPNGIVSYPFSGFIVPMWFAEGVAQYNRKEFGYESWDTHRDMILRMYALDDKMLTWNQMATFGKTSLGNESAYNSGYALVRYIADNYGESKLREISYHLKPVTTLTIDGAIKKAIGKSGEELYDEWKNFIQKDYSERTSLIKNNVVDGEIIGKVGFGNFYPNFSPDGKKIAYVSNKESDYFSPSSIYIYDIETGTEKLLKSQVRSNFCWSPDGGKIYYSKISRDNSHWSNLFDIYSYDIKTEDEVRLTYGLRADAPAVSPDGKTIAFVAGKDGTINLFTMDTTGKNIKQLTNFLNGEQLYNPKWSPDGMNIIFDYSIKDGRDVAIIPNNGGEMKFILSETYDERNPVFTPDGKFIIYASDETGIFNIYKYDIAARTKEQITNVLGGAFMPSVNADGQIVFSSYTSDGFKISFMRNASPLKNPPAYIKPVQNLAESNSNSSVSNDDSIYNVFDWKTLMFYDDSQIPTFNETNYKSTSTGLALIPLIRFDNYNPKNKGIDIIKFGLYTYSYDVLDRFGFFAGAALNKKLERDIFLIFDYRGKIPGLFQLGLEPTASFEIYNILRKTDAAIHLGLDTIPIGVSYNLLEFDLAMKQKIISEAIELELRYTHSRYTASIGSFIAPSGDLFQAFGELYLIGNNLSGTLRLDNIKRTRTMDINPIGRKIRIRYEYEIDKFNPTGEYDNKEGMLVAKYQNLKFHKLDFNWREYFKLPAWKHTLGVQIRGGTIFGPPVDNFFNYYIGGLAGMKGYSFYSLGGNEFALANLTYRFPILEDIDKNLLHVIFNHLYGAIYGDVGTAWTGGSMKGKKFKRDAGIELRLEAFSYYAFPTRIFLNATYGFDKFNYIIETTKKNLTYGKEWTFHFGILFNFDLD
jgi:Tol biopolymer transport system component